MPTSIDQTLDLDLFIMRAVCHAYVQSDGQQPITDVAIGEMVTNLEVEVEEMEEALLLMLQSGFFTAEQIEEPCGSQVQLRPAFKALEIHFRTTLDDYNPQLLMQQVGQLLRHEGRRDVLTIARYMGCSRVFIEHIVEHLERGKYVTTSRVNGQLKMRVLPTIKRLCNEEVEADIRSQQDSMTAEAEMSKVRRLVMRTLMERKVKFPANAGVSELIEKYLLPALCLVVSPLVRLLSSPDLAQVCAEYASSL